MKTNATETQSASDSSFSDNEYFTYSGIFAAMAESVRKNDPELFERCAGMIDLSHTHTLRGLAYLGRLLSSDSSDCEVQKRFAADTIAEVTALVSNIIEMQCDGEAMDMARRMQNTPRQ